MTSPTQQVKPDLVYAVWRFEAQHEDELMLKVGDKITVEERDEVFKDGWWRGHKESGESGIFPQVYTSANPPAPSIESVKISENLTRGTKYSTSSTSAKLDAIGHVRASSHLPERDPVQQDSLSASAPPSSKSESQMSVLQDPNRRWGNASTDCTPPPPSSQSASWIQRTRARSRLASRAKSQTNRQQRHLNMDAATAASQAAPGDLDNPQEVSEPLQSVQKTKRPALQQDTVTPRSSNDNAPPIDTNVTQYTSSGASADTSLSHTADKTPQLPGPQAFTTIGNVSPTDESRPPSSTRLSQESSIYGRTKSIRSIDTSPTTSLKGHFLPTNDPRNWTVEQVVAWAASKEYGDLTQAKLSEHAITGDVLLEMDVPMLREIDIDAFGQRVKIFHGIKQLRQSIDLSPTAVKQDNNWASQSPTAHQVYGTSTHHEATVSDASMYSDPRSEPVQSSSYAHASALVSSIEATPDAESNIRGCDQETTTRNDPMPSEPRVEPADVEGWLRKRGKTLGWKTRYVIVRDSHLYIMHSPLKPKTSNGCISLEGFTVIPDLKTNPGYYGFQLVHSRLPSLRFATSDKLLARQFMKVLSKGSVQRDWSYDPYSSSQIATVSLEEAQTMHPPPRPPAPPASRSAIQKSARAPHLPVLSMDTGHGTTPSIPEDGVASQSVTPRDHNSTLAASPTTRFSSIRSRGSERLSRIKKRASLSL